MTNTSLPLIPLLNRGNGGHGVNDGNGRKDRGKNAKNESACDGGPSKNGGNSGNGDVGGAAGKCATIDIAISPEDLDFPILMKVPPQVYAGPPGAGAVVRQPGTGKQGGDGGSGGLFHGEETRITINQLLGRRSAKRKDDAPGLAGHDDIGGKDGDFNIQFPGD